MKGIPPEVDALMWRLAEEGSPVAQHEFETRHPRFGPELTRRIRMVAELRAAGKTVVSRPTFTPRPVRTTPTPVYSIVAASALGTLAVAATVYVVVTSGGQSSSARPHVVVVQPTPQPQPAPPTSKPDPAPPPQPSIPVPTTPGPDTTPRTEPTKGGPLPAYRTPKDTRIADTSLTAAIQLVAAGGGLQVTIAPGFEDKRVSLDYQGLSPMDTLKAMGDQYGFSVFEEEEGSVLVVPARETDRVRHRVGG